MSRVLAVLIGKDLMEKFLKGDPIEGIEVADTGGSKWKATLARKGDAMENGFAMTIEEIPAWAIFIEGIFIGARANKSPGDAVHDAFAAAGLTTLPEAVEVKAVGMDGSAFMVFTLSGTAYCVPVKQFTEEVAKSGNWVSTRQARRPEIDALMEEIKRLPKP